LASDLVFVAAVSSFAIAAAFAAGAFVPNFFLPSLGAAAAAASCDKNSESLGGSE